MTHLDRQIAEALAPLIAVAETGEQWAEICLREAQMIKAATCPVCGVGLSEYDTIPCGTEHCSVGAA